MFSWLPVSDARPWKGSWSWEGRTHRIQRTGVQLRPYSAMAVHIIVLCIGTVDTRRARPDHGCCTKSMRGCIFTKEAFCLFLLQKLRDDTRRRSRHHAFDSYEIRFGEMCRQVTASTVVAVHLRFVQSTSSHVLSSPTLFAIDGKRDGILPPAHSLKSVRPFGLW